MLFTYVQGGADPTLVLSGSDGEDEISITQWNVDTIKEYLTNKIRIVQQ